MASGPPPRLMVTRVDCINRWIRGPLKDVINLLIRSQRLYGEDAYLDFYTARVDPNGPEETHIVIRHKTPETDAEYERRLGAIEAQRMKEYNQYLQLKAKFETDFEEEE